MEAKNIQSKLLKEYWLSISNTYGKLLKAYQFSKKDEANIHSISNLLINEWKAVYPKFVLNPIEEQVLKLFHKIQTQGFEKEKDITSKIKIFEVYYYTAQYFDIFILPHDVNQSYNEFPRFEIKTNDENLILHRIFKDVWYEFLPDFDEKLYYELIGNNLNEYTMLYEFLSNCWLKTKKVTKSNVQALLTESTGQGITVYLDGTMKPF